MLGDDGQVPKTGWRLTVVKQLGARNRLAAPLEEGDAADIDAEYLELEEVVSGTFFARNPKKLSQMEKKLEKLQAKYQTSGQLVKAVYIPLQQALDQKLLGADRRANPDKHIREKVLKKKAPNFKLPDAKGNQFELSSFLGKVVLVNFWGSR